MHNAFHLCLKEFKTIKTVQFDPKWSPKIVTSIIPNKKAAAKEEKANKDEIHIYLDGSPIKGGVGAAVVLYQRGRVKMVLHKHLGPTKDTCI